MAQPQLEPIVLHMPRAPIDRFIRPLQRFAGMGAAGGIVLLICLALALLAANSLLAEPYAALLKTKVSLGIGDAKLALSVEHWINDALMAIFFFLVGLEIKREVLVGELSTWKKAALPVVAALGGMAVPGGLYAAVNWGHPTLHGWGVPMATDIAFALGVLALVARGAPPSLRVFLATLAIADDIGALLVIAVFYTDNLQLAYFGLDALLLIVMLAMNLAGVRRAWPYALLSIALWFFVLQSGVHSTIAGVLAAATIPASARINAAAFLRYVRAACDRIETHGQNSWKSARGAGVRKGAEVRGRSILASPAQAAAVEGIERACEVVSAPLLRIEHALLPWVTFVILPIFALANAGVPLSGGWAGLSAALSSRECLGIMLGLIVGKPVGIVLASYLAIRLGLGALPTGVRWGHIAGAGLLAGIGFTMSLFIAQLALTDPQTVNHARLGILAGSAVSACAGIAVLRAVVRA